MEWHELNFSSVERDVWLDAGLRRHEAQIAERCQRYGIDPPMLTAELDGQQLVEWLRAGETAASVVARLQERPA